MMILFLCFGLAVGISNSVNTKSSQSQIAILKLADDIIPDKRRIRWLLPVNTVFVQGPNLCSD